MLQYKKKKKKKKKTEEKGSKQLFLAPIMHVGQMMSYVTFS